MSCLPSTVPVVDTSSFTSEEVIEAAIKQLLEKRRLLDASIEVFQKRLRYIRGLSEAISAQQLAYMRSLKESSTHAFLPIRETPTSSPTPVKVMSVGVRIGP
jgi:hypothetical protein